MTSRWVFLTALAFLWSAFGVAGAQKTDKASGSAKQQVISLNGTDSGKLVSAKVGREIMITLQTIGPGEYAAPRVSSASIRFEGTYFPKGQNPGGPSMSTVSSPRSQGRPSSQSLTPEITPRIKSPFR